MAESNEGKGSLEERLNRYLGMIVHEFKTPLNNIIGYAGLLQDSHSSSLSEEDKRILNKLIITAGGISGTINDMLYIFSLTPDNIRMDDVTLSEMVQGIVTELKNSNQQRHVDFKTTSNITVYGDKIALKRLMYNLLENAYKYTSRTPKPIIEFGIEKQNGTPVYFVRDNGVGFDQTHADKLFEPFQKYHSEEYGGTGLGLYIVKNIIGLHGGKIWAKSKEGEGATFYFTLPKPQS